MDFSFQNNLCLENSRSLLRPLRMEDAEGLQPAAFSETLRNPYSPGPIHTPELLERYMRVALEEREKGIRYPFLIIDKTSGAYAGSTSFATISNEDRRLEIGWTWLGGSYHRTGLNRSNKFLMLEYAFDYLGYERVELRADERNERSRRAMEAMGATYEGTLRQYRLGHDGVRRGTVYYSILKPEWQESVRERLRPRA